jgi:hypothetical protein
MSDWEASMVFFLDISTSVFDSAIHSHLLSAKRLKPQQKRKELNQALEPTRPSVNPRAGCALLTSDVSGL